MGVPSTPRAHPGCSQGLCSPPGSSHQPHSVSPFPVLLSAPSAHPPLLGHCQPAQMSSPTTTRPPRLSCSQPACKAPPTPPCSAALCSCSLDPVSPPLRKPFPQLVLLQPPQARISPGDCMSGPDTEVPWSNCPPWPDNLGTLSRTPGKSLRLSRRSRERQQRPL